MVTPLFTTKKTVIAIIGGTGKEGQGLAYRWLKGGYEVIIGSRQIERAEDSASLLRKLIEEDIRVVGMTNQDAAKNGDLVVLTVPYSGHKEMCESIKPYINGKILIDVTVPLVPPKITKVQMPEAGSATLEAKQILGEGVQVISAFQNISCERLMQDENIECDVLVCGGDKASRQVVLDLVKAAKMTGWDAGPIENSAVVEGLTSILLGINKQHGVHSAGIRITGILKD